MLRSIATRPPDGMLAHRSVTSQQYFAGTHLYTWVNRGKLEWSYLSKETTRRARLELQARVPRKPISANRGLNLANRGIHFVPRLDSVPESMINLNLGIN